MRAEIEAVEAPETRLAGRTGPLKLLVFGGSLGARVLNETVPKALALFDPENRPQVLHQCGAGSVEEAKKCYADAVVEAEIVPFIEDMANAYIGALIVIERNMHLDDMIQREGVLVDARISSKLLKNIFYPKAPLHDGAVILSHGRVTAAACILPLAVAIGQNFGTRHRAALCITEESDAIALVVSEERGEISLAVRGTLTRHLEPAQLRAKLNDVL